MEFRDAAELSPENATARHVASSQRRSILMMKALKKQAAHATSAEAGKLAMWKAAKRRRARQVRSLP